MTKPFLRLSTTAAILLGLGSRAHADNVPAMDFAPKGVTRVVQWAVDPFDADKGWALSSESLQFNSGLKTAQQWSVKFTRRTYVRLRKTEPNELEFLKILPSKKKRGNLFLMLGSEAGRSQIFFTADYGETWSYLGTRDRSSKEGGSSGSGPAGPTNLSALNSPGDSPAAAVSTGPVGTPTNGAQFKIYFDFLLHNRPGISRLTFDNYHSFVLVDYIPKPGNQFSFELSPTPRYYQLDYDISNRLGFYIGRILMPFDDMNPHNRFGGYLNNSKSAQPNAPAFLPDIWADLGLGIRYKLLEVSNLSVLAHLYVVNGFQQGGVDPVTAGAAYPNFGALPAPDNNGDKAIGVRFQTDFFQMMTFIFSLQTGSWTSSPAPSSRLNIIGAHARFRPNAKTQIKVGYVYFTVELPAGSTLASFQRGGMYGELRRRFGQFWYAAAEAGILQTDDRVDDPGDQTVVGGRVGYQTGMFDLSFQYRHDLRNSPGKLNRDFTAARFSISL